MYLGSYVFGRQPSLLCLFFQRGSIPELLRCASGHNLHFTQPYWLHDFQAAGFLVVFPRMAFLPVKSLGYICECSKRKWTNIPFEGFGQIAKNDQKICKIGGFSYFFLTIVESSPPPTLPLRCYHLRNSARRDGCGFGTINGRPVVNRGKWEASICVCEIHQWTCTCTSIIY